MSLAIHTIHHLNSNTQRWLKQTKKLNSAVDRKLTARSPNRSNKNGIISYLAYVCIQSNTVCLSIIHGNTWEQISEIKKLKNCTVFYGQKWKKQQYILGDLNHTGMDKRIHVSKMISVWLYYTEEHSRLNISDNHNIFFFVMCFVYAVATVT